LANIFFALIFFGIIFANVFGVQAYNVKKMLPRLIVAAILVQLSYVLVALAYDISGVLSGGLRSLLDPYVPALNFNGATPIGSAVTVGASALLAVAVASHVASVGLIAAVLPLGFGMLSTLFTLALLDVARVFFVLTAAPGFAAMVLPGTQPTFKKWMNGLILVLMMPVIIVLLFMVGKFAAFAAAAGGGDLGPFIALLCLALSLLAAPFSFTFAKGTIGQLTKLADSRVKGVGKGIGSSQLLQNRAQNRQDKAAMNYANPRFGVASRLRSRAQTGQLWSGSVGQQRLAGSYNKIVNDRQKALNQQFTNLNPADQKSVLTSLANGNGAKDAAGKRVGGFKNDAATQVAALQRLMQDRQYDALRDKVGASVKSSQAWRTATQSHMGDLFKEAPDLVAPGGIASVATATPAALGDMHSSTLERAMKDTTVAPQMLPSLQQLSGNAGLRNKIKSTDAAKLWENAGNFKGQKVWVKDTTAPGGKKEVEGDVFIRDHLLQVDAGAKDAAGNWTSATSARIKDATA
jgi:hypothetical protein